MAPTVCADAAWRSCATPGASLVSVNVGTVPPKRTGIGTRAPPTTSPTVSTITGSTPPVAGTSPALVRERLNPGRASVTTIVSGSYPVASATIVAVVPAPPSTPWTQ